MKLQNLYRSALVLVLLTPSLSLAEQKTYKLYDQPNATVEPFCDEYTELVIDTDGKKGTAELTNRLSGECDLFVAENKRSFKLVLKEKTIEGSLVYQDKARSKKIEIEDFTSSKLEIFVPAMITVREVNSDGSVHVLYSKD